jgi:hypothetical protein
VDRPATFCDSESVSREAASELSPRRGFASLGSQNAPSSLSREAATETAEQGAAKRRQKPPSKNLSDWPNHSAFTSDLIRELRSGVPYTNLLYHIVYGTKDRAPFITQESRSRRNSRPAQESWNRVRGEISLAVKSVAASRLTAGSADYPGLAKPRLGLNSGRYFAARS